MSELQPHPFLQRERVIHWHVHVDGASSGNPGNSGAGIFVQDDEGKELLRKGLFLGEMTNNMAEYEALLHALTSASERSVKKITVYTDSLLVANQVNGLYKIKNATLFDYVRRVKKIVSNFEYFKIQYIPREQNKVADRLAKDAIKKGQTGGRSVFNGEESPGIEGQDGS